jgi:hypothetical protein
MIVDQSLYYEYVVNALYTMALGKVVLCGNVKECQSKLKRFDIPIINIKHYIEDKILKLDFLILNKEEIIKINIKSREFVDNFHSSDKMAKKYVGLWQNKG